MKFFMRSFGHTQFILMGFYINEVFMEVWTYTIIF